MYPLIKVDKKRSFLKIQDLNQLYPFILQKNFNVKKSKKMPARCQHRSAFGPRIRCATSRNCQQMSLPQHLEQSSNFKNKCNLRAPNSRIERSLP